MNKDIYEFWKNNSLKHIKPNRGGEFPEGWDVVDFFENMYTVEEYGEVIDVGCGYGRLCTAFDSENYLGLDYSSEAINTAIELHPEYMFEQCSMEDEYLYSDTKLLYTVLLHIPDNDIEEMVHKLRSSSERIIVAEILGRDWRRSGNPPVFNRDLRDYVKLFGDIVDYSVKPCEAYTGYKKNNTNVYIMEFEGYDSN